MHVSLGQFVAFKFRNLLVVCSVARGTKRDGEADIYAEVTFNTNVGAECLSRYSCKATGWATFPSCRIASVLLLPPYP